MLIFFYLLSESNWYINMFAVITGYIQDVPGCWACVICTGDRVESDGERINFASESSHDHKGWVEGEGALSL